MHNIDLIDKTVVMMSYYGFDCCGDYMYSYIEGKVVEIESNFIVIDNNGIGYQIYTPNPYQFNVDECYHIYLYEFVKEDEISLYGFMEKCEKELFLKLINVKGLGCKMALPILGLASIEDIVCAIEREDISYLKKFPKIGEKVAKQIILDLKGKLTTEIDVSNNNVELVGALKSLGYKNQDIKCILPLINMGNTLEVQIKDALKLLLK